MLSQKDRCNFKAVDKYSDILPGGGGQITREDGRAERESIDEGKQK